MNLQSLFEHFPVGKKTLGVGVGAAGGFVELMM